MSGPLVLYRTTVNLRGLGSGTEIEIDPTDPRWAGDISSRRVVAVRGLDDPEIVHEAWTGQYSSGGVSETYLTDDDGPAPDEWVEDWDSGAIVDLRSAGQIDRDLMARDD